MRPFSIVAGLLSVILALPAGAQGVPGTEAAPAAETPAEVAAPVSTTPRLTAADVEAWTDGFMPYALQRGDVAGAVVVVVKDGQVLFRKGYGYADVAARTPVDPERTLFRPGSVSKLVTWTAVMQQVEQGKIDLDADINTYLDFEIPPFEGQPVTMRQVMTHTTGMEETARLLITADEKHLLSLGDTLKHWVPTRIYAPGSTPAYSNYATALAGYVVERVSGLSFDDYLDQNIFAPLEMKHSSFRQPLPPELLAQMSKGYGKGSDDKDQPYEFINLAPAGSLAATGTDMARFMIAHLQKGAYGDARILEAGTAEQMHDTALTVIPSLNRMVLGFYETNINGHRSISHGGDTQWFHSYLHLFPDDNVGLFVSVNSGGKEGASGAIRGALFNEFAERYLPGPDPAGEGVDAETAKLHAQQIAGLYENSRRAETSYVTFAYATGQLKVLPTEDGSILVPALTGLDGQPKKWREIAPYVWLDDATGERLSAEVIDGKVTRFSTDPFSAFMVFSRVPWYKASTWLMPAMGLGLVVLLLTVLAWPVSAGVRRHYGVRYALSGDDARVHRWQRITALVVLLTMAANLGLIVSMLSSLSMMSPSLDKYINLLRVLATLLLPLGALVSAACAWSVLRSRRRKWAKFWAVLLALSCLVMLWVGWVFNLIGYGANY